VNILALVEAVDHVCCRYRVLAFRDAFHEAGHALAIRRAPSHRWDWLRVLPAVRRADLVVLQRRLVSRLPLYLLRLAARRLVFDFDDAVFQHDSHDPRGPEAPWRRAAFARLTGCADAVVAGNHHLAAYAARWTDPPRVSVIPTCVEPSRYPQASHPARGAGVELVWIGSSRTLRGLEQARPLLEAVGACCPGARLTIIADRAVALERLPVRHRPWTAASEARDLAAADVGVSWLPDDDWSRGKCGLKVLQYMAAALPVVANPVGLQRDLVRPGESGYLAGDAADWIAAVRALGRDPSLRRRLGGAGRRRVEAEYTVARGAARWLEILPAVARTPARRRVPPLGGCRG
jgi:glycosyltransferase involved in cell wall biosynthesis